MIRGAEIVFGLVTIILVLAIGVVLCYGLYVRFMGWRREREIQKLGRDPKPKE